MNIAIKIILTACCYLALTTNSMASTPLNKPLWTASGFKMPESVEYDKKRDVYYISNVNDGIMSQDGNGSIGLIDGSGKVIAIDWVTGLHSPKGLALREEILYVADIGELVLINVETAKIIARYEALDSKVLNGISVSKKGQVFVSDWAGNKIYQLDNNELKVWLNTSELNSPNGLWIDKKHLYVASWGANPKADFSTDTTGKLLKISLKNKKITTLDQGDAFINMDGIYKINKKEWLISDFIKGNILKIDHTGKIEKLIHTHKSSADFYYRADNGLLIVPYLLTGSVSAFKIP